MAKVETKSTDMKRRPNVKYKFALKSGHNYPGMPNDKAFQKEYLKLYGVLEANRIMQ